MYMAERHREGMGVEGETRGPGIAPFNLFDPIGFPIGAWFPSLGVLFAHFFVQQHNQLNIEVRSRGRDLVSRVFLFF